MPKDTQWYPAVNETGVLGRFEYYDQLDVAESKKADEEKTKRIIVCWAKVIGDPDMSPIPLKPHNKQQLIDRFPDAWKAFNGEEVIIDGTPLTELGLGEAKILDFRINGVTTVEQVAVLSDAQCEAIGFGTRKLRADAQALMAKKKQEAEQAVLEAAASLPKRKPGRPRKNEAAQVAA